MNSLQLLTKHLQSTKDARRNNQLHGGTNLKRLIYTNTHRFDDIFATPGRIAALNEIEWDIDDDLVKILSEGVNTKDVYYQAMPIRKPIILVEYSDQDDDTFVVTYEDGTRSKFKYTEGADYSNEKKRYYWTYVGRA